MKDIEFSVLLHLVRTRLKNNLPLSDLNYPDEAIADALWIIQSEEIIQKPEDYAINSNQKHN